MNHPEHMKLGEISGDLRYIHPSCSRLLRKWELIDGDWLVCFWPEDHDMQRKGMAAELMPMVFAPDSKFVVYECRRCHGWTYTIED